jgi:hypothetical protein
MVRTFGRASALGYPLAGAVPLTRKVAQVPASATVGLAAPGPDDPIDRAPAGFGLARFDSK